MGKCLQKKSGTYVDFFKVNILDYRLSEKFDIIFIRGRKYDKNIVYNRSGWNIDER